MKLEFVSSLHGLQLLSRVRVGKPYAEDKILRFQWEEVTALWDTGAVTSGISLRLAQALGLRVREHVCLGTAAGQLPTFNDIVLLDLLLDGTVIPVKAAVIDKVPGPDNDFVIGMDVMRGGDLHVCPDESAGVFRCTFTPRPGVFRRLPEIFSGKK